MIPHMAVVLGDEASVVASLPVAVLFMPETPVLGRAVPAACGHLFVWNGN